MAVSEDDKSAKLIDAQLYVFVNLYVTEVIKGNMSTTTIGKEGWSIVHAEFKRQTNTKYTMGQLKNKWDAMKADYTLFKKLMHLESGLGWNEATKTILASDTWWNDRIAANHLNCCGMVAALSCRSTSSTAGNQDPTLLEAVQILKSMPEVPYGGDLYYYAQIYLIDKGNRTLFLSEENNELRYGQLMYNFKYNNHKAAGQ